MAAVRRVLNVRLRSERDDLAQCKPAKKAVEKFICAKTAVIRRRMSGREVAETSIKMSLPRELLDL